ncbi:MAG: hypothetical protein HY299_14935 [Verrucomicrobia bacterium]|nr:hypothetical protein [Verrucomicrobiota bacterium]
MSTQLFHLRSTLLPLACATLLGVPLTVSAAVVQWDFNGNLAPTLGSSDLAPGFAAPAGAAGVSFTTATIAGQSAQVASFTRGTWLRLTHGLPPNGGGSFLNKYTLIMDVMFPSRPAGLFTALFQTSPVNANDAEWFLNPAGALGVSGVYGGSVPNGAWRRLALVVDSGAGTATSYVDGVQVATTGGATPDGRWSLSATALLFADDTQESAAGLVNSAQLRDEALTGPAIAALGGPSAAGVPPPVSPIVTTLADSGPGSLRQAILVASARPGADVITFASGLSGGLIRLTSAQFDINDVSGPVTITAAGLPGGVTISGEGAHRVFRIAAGSVVALDSLTVSNGLGTAGFLPGNGGGGAYSEGTLILNNCAFVRNTVPPASGNISLGGAVSSYHGTLAVTNCTFALNSIQAAATAYGGAIVANASTLLFRHCTIVSNTATGGSGGNGGGILTDGGSVQLGHTIIAGNIGSLAPDVGLISGATGTSQGYNLLGNGTGSSGFVNGVNGDQVGTGASVINPRLGSLQNNGGPTPTMEFYPNSPAFNMGNPAFTGSPLTDQRGVPRVVCGRIDIGAVELRDPALALAPLTNGSVCVPGQTLTFRQDLVYSSPSAVFVNNFNGAVPAGMTLTGNAAIDGGYLKLTSASLGQQGRATLDDFAAGQPVAEFTATFKASLFGGTTPPADGFSFSLAPSPAPDFSAGAAEEGVDAGLSVTFDTFDNFRGEAPAVGVKWNGAFIAQVAFQASQSPVLVDPIAAQRNVVIQLHPNGTLDVRYGNAVLFDHLPTPYAPIAGGQWVLGGRTGGLSDNQWIDDLRIEVPPTSCPIAYQWYKDDLALAGKITETLVVPSAGPADSGVYCVVAAGCCNRLTNCVSIAIGSANPVVANVNDSGAGSLRNALLLAAACPGPDVITFAPALSGQVIRLTSAELLIDDASGPLTITATNLPNGVVLSGEGARRVFRVGAGSTVTLDSLTISNGFAPAGLFANGNSSGGIFNQGRLDLRNCTLLSNSCPGSVGFAGALGNYGGDLRLTNCTLTFNNAGIAGAIYSYLGPCALSHCTIVSNTASVEIGGVATESSPLSLTHALLANPGKDLRQTTATITSGGYNLVADGSGSGLIDGANGDHVGTTATPINPRLGPLQDNGGPTLTHLPLAGSPAIDSGNPSFVGLGLADQRGFPRVASGRIDIGAVENCLALHYPVADSTLVDVSGSSTATLQGAGVPLFGFNRFSQGNQSLGLNDPLDVAHNYYRLRTATPDNSVRDLGFRGDFTVSVWVWNRGGATANGWKVILGLSGNAGGPDSPVFGLYNGRLYLSYWGNDLPGVRVIAPSTWTHVAWTYDSHGGQIGLYVNGQLDASTVGHAHAPRDADLLVGFSEALAGSYFQGALDDLAIYCQALPPNQIAALAANAAPDRVLPTAVLTPSLAAAGPCNWSVREIYAHTNDPVVMPYDLPSALYVASSTQFAKVTNYFSEVINRSDPDTNPGGAGLFGGDLPYASNNRTPQGLLNADDNYFVLAARTTVQIADEDDYTFGFNTDDGGQLRVLGAQFLSSTSLDQAGYVNPANPAHSGDTLRYPGNRPPGATLGVTHLKPGAYDVEFIDWELGGGSSSEVFGARGARNSLATPSLALFNSGVNNAGLPLAAAAIDPHYKLVANPDGGSPNAFVHQLPLPGWVPNTPQSQWIAPRDWTQFGIIGSYTYRLVIDLTGRDVRAVRLTGRWAADDLAEIRVNGAVTGQQNVNLWHDWTPFSLSAVNANFVRGENTIDFVVVNTGSWNGLRVEFLGVTAPQDGFQLLTPSTFLRPLLQISQISMTQVKVNWTPVSGCQQLQTAPTVSGPWVTAPGAVSGQVFPTGGAHRFFRVVQ